MHANIASLAEFKNLLHQQGLHAGLAFLNARVPHRYTSVYRIDYHQLHRIGFVDKLGSPGQALAEAAFKDSFCQIAVENGFLSAADIANDVRLQDSPNPGNFGCYVGLPLAVAPGGLFGTLCHADTSKQAIADDEFAFLQQATPVLCDYLETVAASDDLARTG